MDLGGLSLSRLGDDQAESSHHPRIVKYLSEWDANTALDGRAAIQRHLEVPSTPMINAVAACQVKTLRATQTHRIVNLPRRIKPKVRAQPGALGS